MALFDPRSWDLPGMWPPWPSIDLDLGIDRRVAAVSAAVVGAAGAILNVPAMILAWGSGATAWAANNIVAAIAGSVGLFAVAFENVTLLAIVGAFVLLVASKRTDDVGMHGDVLTAILQTAAVATVAYVIATFLLGRGVGL